MLAHSTVFETAAQPSSTPENPTKPRRPVGSEGFHALIGGSNHGQFHGQNTPAMLRRRRASKSRRDDSRGLSGGSQRYGQGPVNGVAKRSSSWPELDAVLQPGRQPCFVDIVGCHGEHRFDGIIGVGPPVVP